MGSCLSAAPRRRNRKEDELLSDNLNLDECLAHAREAAVLAWEKIAGFYKGHYEIFEKVADGPATEADIMADHFILDFLGARYPETHFGYLSEETAHGFERLERPYVWIIDPIDGTQDFMDGLDDFAVQIGLAGRAEEGGPIVSLLGVVYQPTLGLLYKARRGGGAFRENILTGKTDSITVSTQKDLREANLVVSRSHMGFRLKAAMEQLRTRSFYQAGSLGVKVAHVSHGRADAYLNTSRRLCKEWDLCAPHAIIHEAGGRITDLHGASIEYNKRDVYVDHGVLATNELLHERMLEELVQVKEIWQK